MLSLHSMSGRTPGDTQSDGVEFLRQVLGLHQDQERGWVFVEKMSPEKRIDDTPAVGGSLVSSLRLKFASVARRRCPLFSLQSRWVATYGPKAVEENLLLRGEVPHEHETWLLIEKSDADVIADLPTSGDGVGLAGSLDTFVHTPVDVDVALRAVDEVCHEATVDLGGDGVSIVLGPLSLRDFEKVVFELCPLLPAVGPSVA